MKHSSIAIAEMIARKYIATRHPDSLNDFPRIWQVMKLKDNKAAEVLQDRVPQFSPELLSDVANTPLAVALIVAIVPIIYDILKELLWKRPKEKVAKETKMIQLILKDKRIIKHHVKVEHKLGVVTEKVNLKDIYEFTAKCLIEHTESHDDDL